MTNEKTTKFCPKCGSDDIKLLVSGITGQGGLCCNNCQNRDFIFPEIAKKKLRLLQRKLKKGRK